MSATAWIVMFEEFPRAALAAYGNVWVDSPHWDELALTSLVADQALPATTVPTLRPFGAANDWAKQSLAGLQAAGVETVLFTLAEQVSPWFRDSFTVVEDVPLDPEGPLTAREIPWARLVRRVAAWWKTADQTRPRLVWLQSPGVGTTTVCPGELQNLYFDEFADRGIDLTALSDADLIEHPAVRAALVTVHDHWLGEWWHLTQSARATSPTWWGVGAERGSVWVAADDATLLPEGMSGSVHGCPLLFGTTHGRGSDAGPRPTSAGRTSALLQPIDLLVSAAAWLGVGGPASPDEVRAFDETRPGAEGVRPAAPVAAATALSMPNPTDAPLAQHADPRVVDLNALLRGDATRTRAVAITTHPDGVSLTTATDRTVFTRGTVGADSPARRFLLPEDPWDLHDVASESPELVAQRRALADGVL